MFCQSCGAQVTGAFCTRCGARAVQPPPPVQPGGPPPSYTAGPPPPPPPPPQYAPPPQAYAPPLPPPAKSGAGLTILFIVLGVLGFFGMLGIGAVWYGWHMVKQKAASNGIDLNAITETRQGPARRLDACDLFTKDELSQILSLPVERSEGTGRSTHSTCRYYSSAAVQRGTDQASEAFKKMTDTTNKSSPTPAEQEEAIKNLGTIIKGISGAAAGASNAPVLSIELETDNAKAAMAGFKIGLGITAVVGKDADPKVRNAFYEDVKGLADEAVFGPLLSIFMFRKGDVAVEVDARTLPGGRDTEIAITKRIVSKL